MSSRRPRVSHRQQRSSRVARPLPTGPSQMKANVELRHQFRFTSTSATAKAINDQLLLTAAGVMATSTVLGYALNASVKVNRIELWTPPPSQGSAATCSVLFPASNTSPAREYSDTSVSVSMPAHISVSPPPNSLAGFWQEGSGPTMFTLVAPPGTIIDIWLALILNDGAPPSTNTATLVAATVGNVYYCALDSAVAAGSIYKPVSLTTL